MGFFPFSRYRSYSTIKTPLSKFTQTVSTSLFPSNLTSLFPEQSTTTTSAAAEPNKNEDDIHHQRVKPTKSKKARKMALLINAKPWSAQLESSLSTHTPLSETSFLQTLRLIKSPANALQFFNWSRNTGFTHSEHSYFFMLEILGRARNLNSARNFLLSIPTKSNNTIPLTDKFFNSLIRSYGNAGLFKESIKLFETMKSMGISPSTFTFNNLFFILLKRGRTGMVLEFYAEMLRTYGAKPDLYTFNILIRGFCMNSRMDDAFRFFKEMELFNCKPDLITYNTIVEGLCRAGKVTIAHNVVKGMCLKGENLMPNVVTYTTLVRGYCKKQEIDIMLDLLREMVDNGIKPNEITYNTIINGLCEAQMFDKIKDLLEGWRGEPGGFVPDTCTFNIVMNAHCKMDDLSEAFKVFEKMKELKVQQDSASYSVLIRGLCQKLDFGRAEELLDELLAKEILLCDDGCTPLAAAYNPIFEYLCRNGKTKKAEQVLRQLMSRGIQDPPAYRTLILGHCKEGTCIAGHKLLVLMLRRHFVPDRETYDSLIEALLQNGEPTLAHDTLKRMLISSYLPRSSTFHRILTELVKLGSALESASLVILMLEKEIRQNINLSTDTVKLLFMRGLRDKAFEVTRSLYESGYVLSMEELISFLCDGRKLMEAYELVGFSLKNDHNIDVAICSTVLTSLCKAHKASEAFDLYYKMIEKGIQQPLGCVEDLRSILEAEGKLKEAEFVTKRMPSPSQLDGSG
ncbi:pentatricopeptide repeat-containing protein At1g02060, chloroplastic [Olea europaea var. sylvestris]|uniref:pentatricopeptide repeat-containing protein At1g02060, chloroplastic n=1 Tax=Olea europaea var. sylvestris TaxID=158386 RepID=UPI000C1CF4B9|nr:pentatricopeptide repeat-containing protein At1g02060, chloroplastic [Olea europaea var. sylvestris]